MRYSWQDQRRRLFTMIKKVSDLHGGDDVEWLREYAKDVIKIYSNDLQTAINCFEDLLPKRIWV